jgi:TRAP-type C4-dicarboxylate transport system permease small subunit
LRAHSGAFLLSVVVVMALLYVFSRWVFHGSPE